jgi:nucleolar protein 15
VKKQKPTKDVASKKAAAPAEKAAPKKSALKKEKQSPKTKAVTEKSKKEEPEEEQDGDVPSDAEEEVDDDTNALVQALDSGDEDETEAQVSTFKKGQDVGKAPKAKKSTKASATSSSGTPGVMYLARIPHGFYEHELRSYFGQFGDITRLRVVRNKKTGASRHRAFIEFADAEVADIAARTMDKYLLFGHILSAKTVPPAQVHPDLFKGANRRFKVVPWNQMAGKQLERPLSESQWQVKISKEEQRRAARSEKLKEMGYEFEAPALKAAEAKPLLENGTEEEPQTIEAAPAAETAEPKEEEEVAEAEVVQAKATKSSEEATPQKKKGKKGKKTKS